MPCYHAPSQGELKQVTKGYRKAKELFCRELKELTDKNCCKVPYVDEYSLKWFEKHLRDDMATARGEGLEDENIAAVSYLKSLGFTG